MVAIDAELPDDTAFQEYCRESLTLYLKVERGQYKPSDENRRKDFYKRLARMLRVLASLVATSPRWNGNAQENHRQPGFVSINIGGKVIDAPYFLASDLPPKLLLSQVYRLGLDLRVAGTSTICLSGSACYAGSSKYFGDIDFCEYAPVNDKLIAKGLLNATRGSSLDWCLYRVRLGDQNWQRSSSKEWADLQEKLQMNPDIATSSMGFRQCVHVAALPLSGVIEVTNVLLFVQVAPGTVGELNSTFAFQEAPLATDWIPKDLSDPIELGRYIAWLTRQVSELRAESQGLPLYAIKGARRALALARVTMLGSEATMLVKHLRQKEGGMIAALAARCKLHEVLSSYKSVDPFGQYLLGLRKMIDKMRGKKARRVASYSQLSEGEKRQLEKYVARVRDSLDAVVRRVEDTVGSVPPSKSK